MEIKKMTYKDISDINKLSFSNNELLLRGTDEDGNDITITFNAFNFIQWLNKKTINRIKEHTIEYIKEL